MIGALIGIGIDVALVKNLIKRLLDLLVLHWCWYWRYIRTNCYSYSFLWCCCWWYIGGAIGEYLGKELYEMFEWVADGNG